LFTPESWNKLTTALEKHDLVTFSVVLDKNCGILLRLELCMANAVEEIFKDFWLF
jgi:hypothetical protein